MSVLNANGGNRNSNENRPRNNRSVEGEKREKEFF